MLLMSIGGIAILLIIAAITPPPKKNIGEISSYEINKKITISGKVKNIKNYNADKNSFYVITVEDETGKIENLLSTNDLPVKKEDKVIIEGRITSYQKRLQISVDKLTKIIA